MRNDTHDPQPEQPSPQQETVLTRTDPLPIIAGIEVGLHALDIALTYFGGDDTPPEPPQEVILPSGVERE